jgi:hypothetical protein
MSNLHLLYQASPEEFCAELDNALSKMRQIDARLSECSTRIEAMALLQEEFLKTSLSRQLVSDAPRSWTYDACLPNRYFKDSVLGPERDANGFKRWVRSDARLSARIAVPRIFQYNFSISVADFVSPGAEESFTLKVDGKQYPWMSADGRLFKTVILDDPASAAIDFELFVDPRAVPDGKEVAFSFRSINLIRRA